MRPRQPQQVVEQLAGFFFKFHLFVLLSTFWSSRPETTLKPCVNRVCDISVCPQFLQKNNLTLCLWLHIQQGYICELPVGVVLCFWSLAMVVMQTIHNSTNDLAAFSED